MLYKCIQKEKIMWFREGKIVLSGRNNVLFLIVCQSGNCHGNYAVQFVNWLNKLVFKYLMVSVSWKIYPHRKKIVITLNIVDSLTKHTDVALVAVSMNTNTSPITSNTMILLLSLGTPWYFSHNWQHHDTSPITGNTIILQPSQGTPRNFSRH